MLDHSKITYKENVYEIKGGNHAQFGNYGLQKGDGIAQITADEQQSEAVRIIDAFIKEIVFRQL
ncbi:alpha/beta hydrolase [Dehalobacter sp. DCM]|nr:alpha/beta hydrolase [Dehalobacter sp. DCM]